MDSVRSGPFGQIFRPDNFIFGQVCGFDNLCNLSGKPCRYVQRLLGVQSVQLLSCLHGNGQQVLVRAPKLAALRI